MRAGAGFFGAAFFFAGAAALSSPRLFFSAAIRSITLDPLAGASDEGSWMILLPFFFCFSSISFLSASI